MFAVAETEDSWVSNCKRCGEGDLDIVSKPDKLKAVYRDEYTTEVLPEDLIRNAMREELIYFNDKVWEITDSEGAKKLKDAKVV